jgi:hypothetical protein
MTISQGSPGGYEKSDMRARPILFFAAALLLVAILVMASAYGLIRLLGWWERPRLETPASPLATRTVPAEPRLQVEAPRDLATLRSAEETILRSYGWTDKATGIARIPIDRAVQLALERGLPAPKPVEAAKPPVKRGAR